jgi:hypothetical protein
MRWLARLPGAFFKSWILKRMTESFFDRIIGSESADEIALFNDSVAK